MICPHCDEEMAVDEVIPDGSGTTTMVALVLLLVVINVALTLYLARALYDVTHLF